MRKPALHGKLPQENQGTSLRVEVIRLLKFAIIFSAIFTIFTLFVTPPEIRKGSAILMAIFLPIALAIRVFHTTTTGKMLIARIKNKTENIAHKLNKEQKLYFNAVIFTLFFLALQLINEPPLSQGLGTLLLLFYAYIVIHDVYRWHAALSENLLGKAFIGITFAASSNFAFALAKQVAGQTTQIVPTNLTHTVLFIAILMIPIIMTFAGGVVFAASMLLSTVALVPYMFSIRPEVKSWIFAGTLRETSINYPFITRAFQLLFYAIIGSLVLSLGGKVVGWYESKISEWTPTMIYDLDMYPGRECKLRPGYKAAPLGDAKFLLAHKDRSGKVIFEKPVKCDDLPVPEAQQIEEFKAKDASPPN